VRNLKQVLLESFNNIYFLSEQDKDFIASFGSPGKPVDLGEFLRFWNSLDDGEKAYIMLNYGSGEEF
jgi:hypothetical protein